MQYIPKATKPNGSVTNGSSLKNCHRPPWNSNNGKSCNGNKVNNANKSYITTALEKRNAARDGLRRLPVISLKEATKLSMFGKPGAVLGSPALYRELNIKDDVKTINGEVNACLFMSSL